MRTLGKSYIRTFPSEGGFEMQINDLTATSFEVAEVSEADEALLVISTSTSSTSSTSSSCA